MNDYNPASQTVYDADSDWLAGWVKQAGTRTAELAETIRRAADRGEWPGDADTLADSLEEQAAQADETARKARDDDEDVDAADKLRPILTEYDSTIDPGDVEAAAREFASDFAGDVADAFRDLAESIRGGGDPDPDDADRFEELSDKAAQFFLALDMPERLLRPRRGSGETYRGNENAIGQLRRQMKAVKRFTMDEVRRGMDGGDEVARGPVSALAWKAIKAIAERARVRKSYRTKSYMKSVPADCPAVIRKVHPGSANVCRKAMRGVS